MEGPFKTQLTSTRRRDIMYLDVTQGERTKEPEYRIVKASLWLSGDDRWLETLTLTSANYHHFTLL